VYFRYWNLLPLINEYRASKNRSERFKNTVELHLFGRWLSWSVWPLGWTFSYCNFTTSLYGLHFSSSCPIHIMNYILCFFFPITGLDRPRGFQKLEAPGFQDNRHMMLVRLSTPRTGRFYPPRKYSSFLLEAEATPGPYWGRQDYVNKKFQWHHRESNPRPSDLQRNASINCATACPQSFICT